MLGSVQCKVTALFSANKIVNVTHLSLTDEGFSKSNYWIIHFRNKLAVNEFDFQWKIEIERSCFHLSTPVLDFTFMNES